MAIRHPNHGLGSRAELRIMTIFEELGYACSKITPDYGEDRENGHVVLMAESSFDYESIYLHADDEFTMTGKAVGVIKKPRI